MEGKEDYKEDHKEGKDGENRPIAVASVNRAGLIIECSEYFARLLDMSVAKIASHLYVTDITKFENPNVLLEAVHQLDELLNARPGEGKAQWKALLSSDYLNSDSSITKEQEYYVVINRPDVAEEVQEVNDQIVLEARLLSARELTPLHHRSVRKPSSAEIVAIESSQIPHKVLVVDDAPSALKIMGHLIKRLGHEVVMAEDGLQALDKLRTQTFDIVLMDINMPKMNGLEAAHEFRKIEEERNRLYGSKNPSYLKVIAMSGNISNTLFHEVTNAGFDAFIPKPLTQERFIEVLNLKIPKETTRK